MSLLDSLIKPFVVRRLAIPTADLPAITANAQHYLPPGAPILTPEQVKAVDLSIIDYVTGRIVTLKR